MTAASQDAGTGIWAVVPGAGYSSRMKAYKPLLGLGETTLIGQVISLLRQAGTEEIIVVTGHNHERLAPAVERAGARAVLNPDHDRGMFSSIRKGVGELPDHCQGFFLLPADIPAIRPATLDRILGVFHRHPDEIVIPEFLGTTGHPPLIPAALIPVILSAGDGGNLREILFSGPGSGPGIRPLPVADRGILMDADRPEDYERVVDRFSRLEIPDPDECQAVMDLAGCPEELRAHMETVARVALTLCRAARPVFSDLDPEAIRAGALLHDVCRAEPDHARAARKLLVSLGFPSVAEIAGSHMDLDGGPDAGLPDPLSDPLSDPLPDSLSGRLSDHLSDHLYRTGLREAEVVFLADKLCRGTCLDLDFEQRFLSKADTYPQARERIRNRLETARCIQARIESAAGRSLANILG